MTERISAKLAKELETAFNLFDKDRMGYLPIRELPFIIRALCHYPTPAEMQKMIHDCDPEGYGILHYPLFLLMMARKVKVITPEQEIRDAFRVFDTVGKGYISADVLKHAMCNLGDKITEDQADDMIAEATVDDNGQIMYEEYVEMIKPKPKVPKVEPEQQQ
ncbi:neo-calmodulin-like [Teleopsis dalmanni]|uniref:neo-calmodulin-like n=1 Tax=Teleopsis dalmanni TaxID=139649 RepID=UPI0018CF912B|nr:neo-calmodulin-like [Teleopsis dalmanni]